MRVPSTRDETGAGNSTLPRVSVVIPTYNRSRLLRETVESVLAQTYPNVETIVVIDGSTDDTAEMLAQYAGQVTVIRQANQGVAAARNRGMRAASGEYVTFLDDDDLILPAKIARQVHALSSHPDAGVAHCRYYFADEDGRYLQKKGLLPEGDILHRLLHTNFIWMGAPLIRRRCLDRVGGFDEHIPGTTADWDLWLRIAQADYPFACVQEPLGVYRLQQDSMMADVARLEAGMFAVADRAFANADLPANVKAQQMPIYSNIHFWLSCRYYGARQWDGARRNLTTAMALQPGLSAQPGEMALRFSGYALSPPVNDPLRFAQDVLDHLPACASDLQKHRSQLLSRIHVNLALRDYCAGDVAGAQGQLAHAIALEPAWATDEKEFGRILTHFAIHLPIGSPMHCVDTVFRNLSAQVHRMRRVRARTLSSVSRRLAHQHHHEGQQKLAVRRILQALCYRPTSICQPNTVSVLLQAVMELMKGQESRYALTFSPPGNRNGRPREPTGIPRRL